MSTKDKPDHYEILEQSRSAAIQAAANVFDGLSKAKQLRKRVAATVEDTRQPGAGDSGASDNEDFLFDMLRLHASYMNEVAKLGARYRDFAYRALENMYRVANPGLGNRTGDELLFVRDGALTQTLVVRNDVDPSIKQATIDVPWIKPPAGAASPSALSVSDPQPLATARDEARQRFDIPLPFGLALVVTLNADPSFFAQRKFDDYVYVRLQLSSGEVRERRIPMRLDGRKLDTNGSAR